MPVRRDTVVQTALALVDVQGIDALTMRALAGALGVQPPVLYREFADKQELLEEMADAILATALSSPAPSGPWHERAHERARHLRTALLSRRDGARIVGGRTVPRTNTLRFADALVGDIAAAGFPLEVTLQVCAVLHSYVLGEVLEQQGTEAGDDARVVGTLPQHPGLTHLGAGAPLHALLEFDARFELGLSALLTGMAATAPRRARPDGGAEPPRSDG